jgi:hypothetical protein
MIREAWAEAINFWVKTGSILPYFSSQDAGHLMMNPAHSNRSEILLKVSTTSTPNLQERPDVAR